MQNNYRGVYKWAQRVSPVLLYFFSAGWQDSPNCLVELDDILCELGESGGGGIGIRERRVVIFVVLDSDVLKMATKQQTRFKKTCLDTQQIHLVDLSPYMDWVENHAAGKGGKKLELAETSEGIRQLRTILEETFGSGSESAWRAREAHRQQHNAAVYLNQHHCERRVKNHVQQCADLWKPRKCQQQNSEGDGRMGQAEERVCASCEREAREQDQHGP